MAMPEGVGMIDTMIGFPMRDKSGTYAFITRQVRDRESREEFSFPAQYMLKFLRGNAARVLGLEGLSGPAGARWSHFGRS